MHDGDERVHPDDAAKELGVSRRTLQRWARRTSQGEPTGPPVHYDIDGPHYLMTEVKGFAAGRRSRKAGV